jgi:hypothetical protein
MSLAQITDATRILSEDVVKAIDPFAQDLFEALAKPTDPVAQNYFVQGLSAVAARLGPEAAAATARSLTEALAKGRSLRHSPDILRHRARGGRMS